MGAAGHTLEREGSTAPPRGCYEGGSGPNRAGWGGAETDTGSRPLGSFASLTRSSSSWEKVLCHGLDSGCFLKKKNAVSQAGSAV